MLLVADGEWEPAADTREAKERGRHQRRGMEGQPGVCDTLSRGLGVSEGDISNPSEMSFSCL